MHDFAKINASFSAMAAHYPYNKALPDSMKKYIKYLNDHKAPGDPDATSCCLQVSQSFNAVGHNIPVHSHRRQNALLDGTYHLGAVDEVERYLTGRYGATEEIYSVIPRAAKSADRIAQCKAHVAGYQGILVFRSGWAGIHTELWNGKDILQNNTTTSAMNEGWCFGAERILFWQIGDASPPPALGNWLNGWWDVNDGNQWYYYFSDMSGVIWTRTRPQSPVQLPPQTPGNAGKVTVTSTEVIIDWSPLDETPTRETFQRGGSDMEPATMRGSSSRFAGLIAKKMG